MRATIVGDYHNVNETLGLVLSYPVVRIRFQPEVDIINRLYLLREIEKKILNDSWKIIEKLLGKTGVSNSKLMLLMS